MQSLATTNFQVRGVVFSSSYLTNSSINGGKINARLDDDRAPISEMNRSSFGIAAAIRTVQVCIKDLELVLDHLKVLKVLKVLYLQVIVVKIALNTSS